MGDDDHPVIVTVPPSAIAWPFRSIARQSRHRPGPSLGSKREKSHREESNEPFNRPRITVVQLMSAADRFIPIGRVPVDLGEVNDADEIYTGWCWLVNALILNRVRED